jgi:RNA polymerase sigma-70 factor (ECF subfamily)
MSDSAAKATPDASDTGHSQPAQAAALFRRLSRRVYNFACWHTRDPAAADDIVSTVFEKVIRGLPRYDPARAAPDAWVFAIAMNVVRDYHRARRRGRTVPMDAVAELVAVGSVPEDDTVERDRLGRLLACVGNLLPREREVLTLRLAGGLSNESIGKLCGMRKGHVAVVIHRAVRELRTMFDEQEGAR